MIYIIAGQTASGKSSLALSFTQKINGEIVNADAFQVYRNLDIGTAKPSLEERKIVPHHLFDIVDIDQTYSAFQYQKDARARIDELLSHNIPVVVVGGTGLYIRSMLLDYSFVESRPVDMTSFTAMTNAQLLGYLASIDSKSANLIHVNNRRRLLRAIEIFLSTGLTKSENESMQTKTAKYDFTMVILSRERDILKARIQSRVKAMFKQGLIEECERLRLQFNDQSSGFQAIGYKDIIENPHANFDELSEIISNRTYKYARRQKTFFKNQFTGVWFDSPEDALNYLLIKYEEQQKYEH